MRLFLIPRLLGLLFFLCLLVDSPAHLKHLDEVAFDLTCINRVCIPPPFGAAAQTVEMLRCQVDPCLSLSYTAQ